MQDKEQPIRILTQLKPNYAGIPHLIFDLYGPGMGKAGWGYALLIRFINWSTSETKTSLRVLAETGGVDPETIQRWAIHLENLGLIKITPGDNTRPTAYMILLPPLPAPDHIVQKFFPKNWTIPERAKEPLELLLFNLNFGGIPQEKGGKTKGVGTMPTQSRSSQLPSNGVGTMPTHGLEEVSASGPPGGGTMPTGRPDDAHTVSAPGLQYDKDKIKTKLTNPVYESFLNISLDKLKNKAPEISLNDLEDCFYKCLNLMNDDVEAAKEYFEEKVRVVLEHKNTDDVKGLLWVAIEKDWKPKISTKAKMEAEIRRREQEEKDRIETDELLRKSNLKAGIEEILATFNFATDHLKKKGIDPIEHIKKTYKGNPNLDEVLNKLKGKG